MPDFPSQGHLSNRASNIDRNGSVLEVHGMTEAGPLMAGESGKGGLVK